MISVLIIVGVLLIWCDTRPCHYQIRHRAKYRTRACAEEHAKGYQGGEDAWEVVEVEPW